MQLLGAALRARPGRQGRTMTIVCATSGDTGGAAVEAFARPRQRQDRRPLPRGPHLRGAAAVHDHGGAKTTCARWRWPATSTTARRSSRPCSPTRPSPARSASRRSIRSTSPASPPRASITSPPPRPWARRSGRWPSRRPHRQFRRRLRRLCGQPAHGPAHRAHHRRHQRQRHRRPRPGGGPLRPRCRPGHPEPGHGHPGRLQFRAALFRVRRARRAGDRPGLPPIRRSGESTFPPAVLGAMREVFAGVSVSEAATARAILTTLNETGELIDPHTAVALAGADLIGDLTPGTTPGGARHRPSGQVPRRRARRHRRPTGRSQGRSGPRRPAGTFRPPGRRRRGGEGLCARLRRPHDPAARPPAIASTSWPTASP